MIDRDVQRGYARDFDNNRSLFIILLIPNQQNDVRALRITRNSRRKAK